MNTHAVSASSRRVLADTITPSITTDIALVLGAAALVGALAQVSIPLAVTPVPLTGQTLGVLLVGATLGTRRASVSMALYVIAGLAGVPWFAGHTSHVPTALVGYLIGFLVAGALTGALAARGQERTVGRAVLSMLAGELAIYAVALPWLALSLHVGLATAISLGLRPFVLGDAIKAVVAGIALPGAWRLVERTQSR
jgi:biotin transport system substrate-specific component